MSPSERTHSGFPDPDFPSSDVPDPDPQLPREDLSLELSGDAFEQLVDHVVQELKQHIDSLPAQELSNTEGGKELATRLRESLPTDGQPISEILSILFGDAVKKTFNTASPGYLAYIPGGGILQSAVADLIANTINRYVGVWLAAPGLVQLETNVIRWFQEMVGYPKTAGGFLTSGGSLANFSAVVTARRSLLPDNFLKGVIYTSDQAHHSVQRAALLAGFPMNNIRVLPVDDQQRLNIDTLETAIQADQQHGMTPFMVVGHGGTTNTGAVDDLHGIAEIAKAHQLWFHVDAAYGGFFVLTDHGKKILKGIELADSITLDPHKGLFLPYGTGCLLVRDASNLKKAHSIGASYMPAFQEDEEHVDYCQISPELSRDFRGLRVWLPIKMHGISPFANNLQEKLELTHWITAKLKTIPNIEIVAEPQLSIVAFRLRVNGVSETQFRELNQRLLQLINATQRVYLTPTTLDGKFVIRICVLSFRTHIDRMKECFEIIEQAVNTLMKEL